MSEYYVKFPLCQKYDAPITEGRLPHDKMQSWVESLPDDWAGKFSDVLGQVTCDDRGIYTCDIEDSLFALEKGWKYRRSIG